QISQGLFSGGKGTGTNGNVTIIAGGSSGTTISVGDINTLGGSGGGGNVLIATSKPVIVPNPPGTVTVTNNCTIVGGFEAGEFQKKAEDEVGHICSSGTVTIDANNPPSGVETSGNIIITSPNSLSINTDLETSNGFISITSTG